jgi:hypothetical protein
MLDVQIEKRANAFSRRIRNSGTNATILPRHSLKEMRHLRTLPEMVGGDDPASMLTPVAGWKPWKRHTATSRESRRIKSSEMI